MPRTPLHTLIWSQDHAWYELFSFGQVLRSFIPGDEEAWQAWLEAHDSFSFQGRLGRLNVYKEARPRGGQYWYAYHTTSKRTHKRYLGRTAKVTFAPLEEVAEVLTRGEQFHKTEQSFVDMTRRYFTLPAQPGRHTPAPDSRSPGQVQQASLLLPKLRPPRLPAWFVSRQRLLVRLEEGRQGKLTLVLAPAGSGKTTLVRQWIESQGQDTQAAWLSLDPEDDDPIRFWHYVLTACELFEGEPGQDALKLLSTNQSFFPLLVLKQILTSFLNDAAQQTSRLLVARGETTAALHLLGHWQEEARTWKRLRSELEIHVLRSLAYAASSRPAQAEQALKEALLLAQPEGFQRLFLEKGEQLSTLLRTLFLDLREEPLVSYARGLLLAFASLKGENQAAPHASSALLLEPLTEAEQRVLGLLARGRTNPEIAAALVVSINTVKTQVQSIYRKLGVKSRWEASEAAHRLDLL
jgi:ATP/maltotriose-dependent transcriptional regulator MalT